MKNLLIFSISTIFILIFSCTEVSSSKELKVTFVNFEEIDATYFNYAIESLDKRFKFDTIQIFTDKLPQESYYAPRNRYRADKLIRYLRDNYSTEKVIGITQKDISVTSDKAEDWGVMGYGFVPGKSCVISTFRTFRGAKSEAHKKERLAKVVTHEFGHTLGLPHCKNSEECIMQDAHGKVATVDKGKDFCAVCSQKIRRFLKEPSY